MKLVVRPLSSPSEYEEAEKVQVSAWGMTGDVRPTPKEVMIAMHDNGGLALGAFDGKRMVGFAIMMAAYLRDTSYLYSHMTGVIPEYQSKGVGYLLKQKQKEAAAERGVGLIAWTFDPIIAKNASLNVGKLGTILRNYHVDYYGEMRDSINYGWPTDRVLAEWYLHPGTVPKSVDAGQPYSPLKTAGTEPYPRCVDWAVARRAKRAFVRIPGDIVELKRKDGSEAIRWREATREVFKAYFGAGYSAVSLVREGGIIGYILEKVRLPKNIFSE